MLDVVCTHCGKTLKIPEEYRGQKGKCNHCQGEITVAVAPLKFSAEVIEAADDFLFLQALEAETKRKREKAASTMPNLPATALKQVLSKTTAKTFATAGCGCGCLGLLVIFILVSVFASRGSKNPDGTKDYKIEAMTAAQMAIEQRLKSPGSAKHPWAAPEETTTYIGNNQYRVESHVDSQNSFGASVRTRYVAIVQVDGAGKTTVVKLTTW